MSKIFISGTAGFRNDKTLTELPQSVKNYIDGCIEQDYQILVGDCQGIDTLVQQYLNDMGYNNICVYYVGSHCRNKINPTWQTTRVSVPYGIHGRDFYAAKDSLMARDADFGFAIWDGKSKGTGTNIANMKKQNKPVTIFRTDKNYFENIH